MIRHLVAVSLLVAGPAQAKDRIERATPALAPLTIQLDGIPTSALVTMLLRDVMRVPYVIAPDVLSDRRLTSVRLIIPRNDVPARVVGYLRRAGFSVDLQGGTVFVGRAGSSRYSAASVQRLENPSTPWGSPLSPVQAPNVMDDSQPDVKTDLPRPTPAARQSQPDVEAAHIPERGEPELELEILAYLPAHRPPDYLASIIAPLLPGLKVNARADVKADNASASIAPESGPDVLVMAGSPADLARARRLILALDRARPMVAVKAVVMQVASVQARGSALSILANLAGGKVRGGSFGGEAVGSQFLRIGTGALSAMLSVVREDSRFKVVATPNLAALSGAVASINSGSQVPTVGAVTLGEGGTPIRSVVYRDSGITLTVRPTVRGELIEMDVRQERSNFVRTTTGVEDSPTLQKASANASVTLKSGESIVLAGLNEESADKRREGLLGGLLGVRANDNSSSELLVVLQAEIVAAPTVAPGQFLNVEGGTKNDELEPA
jgi:hypothetical protein